MVIEKYQQNMGQKGFLVLLSLGAGLAIFLLITNRVLVIPEDGPSPIVISIFVAFLYPFVGAFVIFICNHYRSWACGADLDEWNDDKIMLGAVWPLTLVWSLIVYTYLAVINRLFNDD